LMQNFARQARENGASVLTKKSVCSIERISGGWQVSCSGGDEFSAKILINAAGAWGDQIAQMAGITPLGFVPLRRSMARIAAPGGVQVASWPMMFGAGEAWYAKPDAGALLVSPADEVLVEPHDAWAEDLALAEGIDRYQQVVRHEEIRLISSWAGIRTFSPDRSLVIGPDAHAPSFFWMAGQGGYGFQTSPAASQLLCDLVGGSKSELDAATVRALSPARFG
ncbi:MAG: NAD(P)/FAD-dependent oxidoreductase, partial [Paracoccaceae bacterium]